MKEIDHNGAQLFENQKIRLSATENEVSQGR